MRKILSTLILIFLCLSLFADINDELFDSVISSDVEKVKQLIEQGADVNAKDNNYNTALFRATVREHTEII